MENTNFSMKQLLLFAAIITPILFSCTISSVGGNTGNALFYNDTLKAPATIQLIEAELVEFNLNNLITDGGSETEFEQKVATDLLDLLINKSFTVTSENNLSKEFVVRIQKISFNILPTTDTYTEDDVETIVDTKEYTFEIDAQLIQSGTSTTENISVTINDQTRAGKTVFGTIGEKGMVTKDDLISRGIERFVGKLAKEINKMRS